MSKFYTISTLIFASILNAQVGIGTIEPQGSFHIDPLSNTNLNNGISDDLIVDKNGNLGISTTSPTNKLTVVGDNTTNPINIKNFKEFTNTSNLSNLAIDKDSNIGTVSYTNIPTIFFSLLEQTKGLDLSGNNNKINLPISSGKVDFNTTSLNFGIENNLHYLNVTDNGIYSIEAIASFHCDTNKIWGVNLIISKKEINQSNYVVIDSRRILTKLSNDYNIPMPGSFFGVFSLKQGDKVTVDVGTGFAATDVNSASCGTHKPGLNTSAVNFIIKKLN